MNSDFTSKDTSLWSSGICAVLMASIKFSVDCSLCLDWSVKGCSTVVKYGILNIFRPIRKRVAYYLFYSRKYLIAHGKPVF